MSAAEIEAIAGLITAITALLALFIHTRRAHK